MPFILFLLIHGEHALSDEEAAENIDARHDQRGEPQQLGKSSLAPAAAPPPRPLTASSAPTTITEEMALVTLISGVCSAGVTLHTT